MTVVIIYNKSCLKFVLIVLSIAFNRLPKRRTLPIRSVHVYYISSPISPRQIARSNKKTIHLIWCVRSDLFQILFMEVIEMVGYESQAGFSTFKMVENIKNS